MTRPLLPSDPTHHAGTGVASLKQLAVALFDAGNNVDHIFDALAACLIVSLCDGCAITFEPGTGKHSAVTRHHGEGSAELAAAAATTVAPCVHAFDSADAGRTIAPSYATYIARFGLRGLAILSLASRTQLRGHVVVTRDRGSRPFDDEDLAAIETCVEYASLAAESALQLAAERGAVLVERERTVQFQQEMLSIVGHDLRGPVAAILMSTEILAASRKDDVPATHAITRIVSFANRMTRMVDQLLDLTRARLGGQIALSRSQMRLRPVLTSVIENLTLAHPDSRFELVADDIKGIWDADRIALLLANVLGNAVQFGREGGTIRVEATNSDGATRISVHNELRDQPMSTETLATLFEPYRRGWDREHVGTGLGLGLYIAYEIVRAHHGSISAESSSSGTTFHIVLPDTLLS